jgi:hypothetical protein
MENETDPLCYFRTLLDDRLGDNEDIMNVIEECEVTTRDVMHGTFYIRSSFAYQKQIVQLWETEFKHAVANGFRTCAEVYATIADIVGLEKISKHGVKKIVLDYQKIRQTPKSETHSTRRSLKFNSSYKKI